MQTSKIAQAILDISLRVPVAPRRPGWKAVAILLDALKRLAVVVLGDPPVRYELDGSALLLPLSHQLPLIRRRLPDYSRNLARIAAALAAKHPDMTMVDIGANVGDTVAIVRRLAHVPILCIDGDPVYFALLAHNAGEWPDVELANAYVGEESTTVSATTERVGGTGRMKSDAASTATIQTRDLATILAAHHRFRSPKLVKLDTDGFDTRIVRGALDVLRAVRPVVFIEYDPFCFASVDPDAFGVFAAMRDAGYADALFYDNAGAFLVRARLDDTALLEELHAYSIGRGGHAYYDICFFPSEDADVMESVRRGELELAAARTA